MFLLRALAVLLFSPFLVFPAFPSFQDLLIAARLNDLDRAERLLAAGAPPDGATAGFPDSYTPLMFAGRHGNGEFIRLLLARGASVDVRDFNGDRALLWAAQAGQPESVALLLAAGAEPQSNDDPYGRTPLMQAASHLSLETLEVLLAGGADVARHDHSGRTALHYAAVWGSAEILRKLLEQPGVDPNLRDGGLGETPLHIASQLGRAEKVAALLRAGADAETHTPSGMTALLLAASVGAADAVSALLSGGADPRRAMRSARQQFYLPLAPALPKPLRCYCPVPTSA